MFVLRYVVKRAVWLGLTLGVAWLLASTGIVEASQSRAAGSAPVLATHCDAVTADAGTEPCATSLTALVQEDRDRLDRLAVILAAGFTVLVFGVFVNAAVVLRS